MGDKKIVIFPYKKINKEDGGRKQYHCVNSDKDFLLI